jgi:hypothetical protein
MANSPADRGPERKQGHRLGISTTLAVAFIVIVSIVLWAPIGRAQLALSSLSGPVAVAVARRKDQDPR